MQREEKQLDMLLEASLLRLNDLKRAIGSMLLKIETEHETISWPTFLDNFAIISGHLTGLSKILAHEMTPPLRNLTVLPLHLSPDVDEHLLQVTEGRIAVFSAECAPDYLRTKLDPVPEMNMALHEAKANALSNEAAMKQVTQYTKVVSHVHDLVQKARDEWEIETMNRTGMHQTSSQADTQALVKAVGMGTSLKVNMGVGPNMNMNSVIRPPLQQMSPGVAQIGKLPSSIKTNIKSAQLHPYR